jgi:putative mRNA 3-end processing factor
MISKKFPLVAWTPQGLYCHAGGFYIDPHRAVDCAIITHAHSDHARRGSKHYICENSGIDLLRTRLGKNIRVTGYDYGEQFQMGDVLVSLHSAGHILGSSQVRIQRGSEVWVASGDYKRDRDPSCAPFETVKCDTFITEATFGTPKFTWAKDINHGEMIADWWKTSRQSNKNCLLFGYSLGKAQRILAELAQHADRPVLIHSSIVELTECYRRQGRNLAQTMQLEDKIKMLIFDQKLEGELILAPPSILKERWSVHLGNYETAFASGWMQGSGRTGYRGGYDRGFVMSDHADWNDLNQTINESEARRIYVQHRNGALIQHLRRRGLEAFPVEDLMPERYQEETGYNLRLI